MSSAAPSTAPRPRLPRLPAAVYILAGLMVLKAVLLLGLVAGAAMTTLRSALGLQLNWVLVAVLDNPALAALLVVLAILLLLSAFGVVLRRRTGWLLAMVLTGLFVAADIYGFINGTTNHIWMALNIITVFYLNQRDVRDAVGAAGAAETDA